MADFSFLQTLPTRIGNFLKSRMGDVGEFAQNLRQNYIPSKPDPQNEALWRMMSRVQSEKIKTPVPKEDVLNQLAKQIIGGGEQAGGGEKKKEEKPQTSNMTVTTPTPEGGKVTIKVDVPQWQDKPAYPQELWPGTQQAGQEYGVDPQVLASQIATETGGYNYEPRPGAAGERGISQIIPQFFYQDAGFNSPEEYGRMLETDPQFALNEAARILSQLLEMFSGDYTSALGAYNAGPSNPEAGRGYAEGILGRLGR